MTHHFLKNQKKRVIEKRTSPDKRITISEKIIMIEYPCGRDLIVNKSHPFACNLLKEISIR
jgi:hypothetical protein